VHRRHHRAGRNLQGAADGSGVAGHLPRHPTRVPARHRPQLHQPDVDPHARRTAGDGSAGRRSLPLGAGNIGTAGALPRRPVSGAHVGVRRHQSQRVVHEARARRRGHVPAPARACAGQRRLRAGPGPLRDDAAPRLLRHRVERSLLGIRSVVPQTSRADPEVHARRLQGRVGLLRQQLAHVAREVRRMDRRPHRGTQGDSLDAQLRVRGRHRRGEGAQPAEGDLRQRPQRVAGRQPPGRLRRGRVPRRPARRAALPLRPPARAVRGDEPLAHGRPRAGGPGPARPRPRGRPPRAHARPAHGGGLLAAGDRLDVRRDVDGSGGFSRRLLESASRHGKNRQSG